MSYTELEFDEAGAAAIPRLVFLLDEAAHDAAAADPEQAARGRLPAPVASALTA